MNIHEIFFHAFLNYFVSLFPCLFIHGSRRCFIIKRAFCVVFVRHLFHHVWNIQIRGSCLCVYKRLTFVINMTLTPR